MQVVLTKRVPKLGQEHDIVNVSVGYARNFLFTKGLAIPANEKAIKKAETLKLQRVEKMESIVKNAKEIAEKLKSVTLKFTKKAKDNKLYGSISSSDLEQAFKEQAKIEVSKSMIESTDSLKTLGEHVVKLNLAKDIVAEVKILIEAE